MMQILLSALIWVTCSAGEPQNLNGVVFEKKAIFVANQSPWLGYVSIQDDFTESWTQLKNLTAVVSMN